MAEQSKWYLVIQGYDRLQPDEESALRAGLMKIELMAQDEASAFRLAREEWNLACVETFTTPNGQVYPRSPKIVHAFEPDWPNTPGISDPQSRAATLVQRYSDVLRGPFQVTVNHGVTLTELYGDLTEEIMYSVGTALELLAEATPLGRMGTEVVTFVVASPTKNFANVAEVNEWLRDRQLRPATSVELKSFGNAVTPNGCDVNMFLLATGTIGAHAAEMFLSRRNAVTWNGRYRTGNESYGSACSFLAVPI